MDEEGRARASHDGQGPIAAIGRSDVNANDWRETIAARRAKIENSDPGWKAHLADMQARGFSSHEARNKWLSPPKFKGK